MIPQLDKVHRLHAGHGCQGLLSDLRGAVALDLRGAGISRVRKAACLEAGRGPPGVCGGRGGPQGTAEGQDKAGLWQRALGAKQSNSFFFIYPMTCSQKG